MLDWDNQVEYWDRVGPTKQFAHPINLERLSGLLTRESRILDVGCGYGRTLLALHDHGYRNLAGVDPAPAMIAAARSRVPLATFQVMNPPSLPFPDGSVDGVLLFTVLTCIPSDDGQRALIQEVSRVLRPGGLLHLSDLWVQEDRRNRNRYDRYRAKYGVYGVFELPEGVVLRHHERRWIEELTSGFLPVALDDIAVRTMNGHRAQAFQWYGRKAVAV